MTPQDTIRDALVPGTHSVLALGSFERRVTVYSQQIRALNLADAMISQGLVAEGSKIAIVGGGAAGITAAVALSAVAARLRALDLFEARANVLELQHNSMRFLHPHFYDWPSVGWQQEDAGLPIMNWHAGYARDVACTLKKEFEAACGTTRLSFHPDTRVTGLKASSVSTVRVNTTGAGRAGIYNVVILAIGFGLERHLDGETDSYWASSALAQALLVPMPQPQLFISGNGDGGLVDFQMAAFDALDHREVCRFMMNLDLGSALAEIEAIETEAWLDADLDIFTAYRDRVHPLVPAATYAKIVAALRGNVRIRLHTNEPNLLRRTTALHNRLATFLLIEADRINDRNFVEITTGIEFSGGVVPVRGPIKLTGEAAFEPHRRFLRLGPDGASNLAPFDDVLATYPGRLAPRASATRPESPVLNISARDRFRPAAADPVAAPASAAPPTANATLALNMSPDGLSWSGDYGPEDSARVWRVGQSLCVHIALSATEAGPLVASLARLGCHAATFRIYTGDTAAWRASIQGLCASKMLPGPHVPVTCVVEEWSAPGNLAVRATASLDDIVALVDGDLDREVLRSLNEALYGALGPPGVEIGWPIELGLKQQLWSLWQEWHRLLSVEVMTCRRFLALLANEQDRPNILAATLVRVGPKSLAEHLIRPTIFALTFATCSGYAGVPASVAPGNMRSRELTVHACGVSWIEGRDLGRSSLAGRLWTTGVVLLSHLKEAFRFTEGDVRFDYSEGTLARLGTVLPENDPLVIGADDLFVQALEGGQVRMVEYLQGIFALRSAADQARLKEQIGG